MSPIPDAQQAAALLQSPLLGSPSWWTLARAGGLPRCEALPDGTVCVTFVWRDPDGDERRSPTQRVYVDVNSVTDHHSLDPQSLTRIDGTDVWWWQVAVPADWRGSYAYIPVHAAQLPPLWQGDAAARRLAQRQWWRSIMDLAVADPLNPSRAHLSSAMSALHMPAAPAQTAWHGVDSGARPTAGRVQTLAWKSRLLGNERPAWLFSTGETSAAEAHARPLAVLLDGQRWAGGMPVCMALDEETRRGRLPPAVYLLIDAIDGRRRDEELSCHPTFWDAVQTELLPMALQCEPATGDPSRTVVAGQSLGGLAAMYAGLTRPERFGCVLSQSGSFWWPHVGLLSSSTGERWKRRPGSRGALTDQVEAGRFGGGRLRIFQEVGSREDVMIDVNETLRDALRSAGHHVHFQLFEGGHDSLCWRGGLIDGLAYLLGGLSRTQPAAVAERVQSFKSTETQS